MEVQDDTARAVARQIARDLAALMDENSDGGQWCGPDICDAFADWIDSHDGWAHCPDHGVHSASAASCPQCDDEVTDLHLPDGSCCREEEEDDGQGDA